MVLTRTIVVALLSATAVALSGCLTEDRILVPFETLEPRALNDGWTTTTPEAAGFDQQKLEQVYRDLHNGDLWQIRSLLVFRNGALVAESYFKDEQDLTTPRAIWSCTKQFTGVLYGIAVDRGVIGSVNDSLGLYLEETRTRFTDKAGIRIKDLLEMRSGIAFDNDGADGQTSQMLRKKPSNSADFILGLPMNAQPGTVSDYNDGNPHLLSICLQRRTGVPMDVWADTVLFDEIGFRNYRWERYPDGTTLGAFGILTTPREMARLAQLVLNQGQWNGRQVVSQQWVADMTAPNVESYSDRWRFGYQWWYDVRLNTPSMNGHGGQYAIIDRESGTIVVITAEPNTQGDHQINQDEGAEIFERVIATLR